MGKKNQTKNIPEPSDNIDTNNDEMEGAQTLEGTKKGKKSKKKNDTHDDLAKDLEEMTIKDDDAKTSKIKLKNVEDKKEKNIKKSNEVEVDVGSDSDDGFQPTVGGGFAALMDDFNDDDDDADESEDDQPVSKPQLKEKQKKKENIAPLKQENGMPKEKIDTKKEKGKKSKSKRKGKDDEEDIEQLLLELESEYSGVKKQASGPKGDLEHAANDGTKNKKSSVVTDTTGPLSDPVDISEETSKASSKKRNRKEKVDLKIEEIVISSSSTDIVKEEKHHEMPEKKDQGKTKVVSADKETSKGKNKKEKELKDNEPLLAAEKLSKKNKSEAKEKSPDLEVAKEEKETTPVGDVETDSKKKKKQKGKEDKKKKEEDAKGKKGKPNQKMIDAMKELLAKKKEEEERLQKEEEERIRLEDERIMQLEEQRRLEEERKERLKQKQKDRLKRLKEEGKLLTPKQKLDQKRAQVMLEFLKAQGVAIPEAGEKVAPITHKKSKKKKLEDAVPKEEEKEETCTDGQGNENDVIKEGNVEVVMEEEVKEDEGVVEAWDELSSTSEAEDNSVQDKVDKEQFKKHTKGSRVEAGSGSEPEDDSDNNSEDHQTEAEKRKERAKSRIEQRKVDNEKNRSEAILRSPVVCVLGHVDHGKTKILDKLRRTNVQEGEVGGITQQIGATNVPFDAIRSQTRMVKDFEADSIRLPGLLIIDTPGHESFSNLRNRGSSLCDIAILVVDITQGLEPQTIESINLLKTKKTPFVVALNKVDRVFEWDSNPNKDIREVIKLQNEPCKNDFERRTKEVIQALNNEGLNAALFWENPDPRSYCSLVPTSAISGDGMGNLMSLITSMCQKRLANRLMFSNELQCTVLEVKTIQGHGTTIDVILVNGRLREGDTLILAGTEGPIVTQLRSLLIPKPMKEIRVKGQYDELKEVQAALGVKIAAKELEKAIAGLNLQVAYHEDEVEILKEDVDREFKTAMRSMKVKDRGVYVQASTLGALEALLEFFKVNKVPYSGIRVGPVVKRDVMKAAAMLEHDPMYAVILAFDVKVERDAQELADKEGVKIFSEETIYHLGDRYVEYIKEYKKKKQDEFRHVAVFPSKLKIIPTAIFNKRDPIVLGVTVEAGILRTGTPLCVPSKEFVEIGIVTSLEFDHKVVDIAKKGVSVCMKVEPIPGHTPKLYGRHFEADDFLVSKISRESIDACKQYFRDDLGKLEWKLMAELKKQFGIL